ncbi:hypothetical protein C1I91_06840 [Clostridium manihotivorum]|uniref:Uncharacterized protein n=1 Tax=Clostridium manihotivorum TaxID=2320868 RepID=A0A3R5X0M7_9CLOT|nr:hypothetical protein C1I91_06840 [Clostridium manihotivorum]
MALLIIFFVIIMYIEIPPLIKNNYVKELAVSSVLIFLAFIVSVLFILDIHIFNPVEFIIYVIKDLLHLNYK